MKKSQGKEKLRFPQFSLFKKLSGSSETSEDAQRLCFSRSGGDSGVWMLSKHPRLCDDSGGAGDTRIDPASHRERGLTLSSV